MLVGSFVAGCIPLSTKMSESKLRLLTALGVGLLIGTALVVIIPEGIETLYSSTSATSAHTIPATHARDAPLQTLPSSIANLSPQTPTTPPPNTWVDTSNDVDEQENQLSILQKRQQDHHASEQQAESDHNEHGGGASEHTAIGIALIVGFAVMFVVDQLSSLHLHASSQTEYSELGMLGSASNSSAPADNSNVDHFRSRSPTAKSMTPTIGLIVHAAADGIALGASASHPQLSMVVFLAIMLHKAPSAFALTTVLLSEGLSRVSVRRHLLLFSLSAPSGAIATYLLLYVFSSTSQSATVYLAYWTGILLVFSGGTFLYVAMHALQELQLSNGHLEKLSSSQIGSILGGMFLPVILNVGHSH